MQQKISIKLLPHEAEDIHAVYRIIAKTSGKKLRMLPVTTFLKNQLMPGAKQFG